VRIAVISPFVDRQHGTERAVGELIEHLSTQHGDQIDLYAQRVSGTNVKSQLAKRSAKPAAPQSTKQPAEGTDDGFGITWHQVRSFPGPHLIQFLAWLFLIVRRASSMIAVVNLPALFSHPGSMLSMST
jgi:hypothetical protein